MGENKLYIKEVAGPTQQVPQGSGNNMRIDSVDGE
jgi:hypothetical protein